MSYKKRGEWGYASYNVDSEEDGPYTYTRYETDGSVNRYTDLGNGKHSHQHWKNKDDYNMGRSPDQERYKGSKRENPSQDEVDKRTGCYLTSACMNHYKNNFNDNCYELELLRWFRDNFVSKEDVEKYYEVAPTIVDEINKDENKDVIYQYIYEKIINYSVRQIENENYKDAYKRYKNSVQLLESAFIQPTKVKTKIKK